jgi:DNA-3-methyladenine glycosylase II
VSVAAADGIWRRIEKAGAADLAGLSTCPDGLLQACGLSEAKRRSARAIAESGLDFTALAAMPEAEAKAALCALRGVGPWTAEVYLMFCVGRADVFAPGDLALQEGARSLFGLEARPAPKALAAMAGPWSPWRAVAARMLWAWYAHVKGREGVSQ